MGIRRRAAPVTLLLLTAPLSGNRNVANVSQQAVRFMTFSEADLRYGATGARAS
jgi:hypothetical protein